MDVFLFIPTSLGISWCLESGCHIKTLQRMWFDENPSETKEEGGSPNNSQAIPHWSHSGFYSLDLKPCIDG